MTSNFVDQVVAALHIPWTARVALDAVLFHPAVLTMATVVIFSSPLSLISVPYLLRPVSQQSYGIHHQRSAQLAFR